MTELTRITALKLKVRMRLEKVKEKLTQNLKKLLTEKAMRILKVMVERMTEKAVIKEDFPLFRKVRLIRQKEILCLRLKQSRWVLSGRIRYLLTQKESLQDKSM